MTKLTKNALNLNEDRIKELIENAKYIRTVFNNMFEERIARGEYYSLDMKADKANSLYKKYLKEDLTVDEKTILILYFLIPNDNKLSEKFLIYKGNFDEIAKYFGVTKNIILLRWLVQRKMAIYNKNIKKLTLTNEESENQL